MSELPLNKKMKIIKLYLEADSYDDIAKKAGVAKGSVFNTIQDLKEGLFPEVSTITEEIEQLRELATGIKRHNMSPVKAIIGLSVLEQLTAMAIEPQDIEKCHTLLQALAEYESDLPAMARSILSIEEVKQTTGMTLEGLEAKVVSLKKDSEKLTPLSEEVEARKKELKQLEIADKSLSDKARELREREAYLSKSIDGLESKETKVRNHVVELEERARTADRQLLDVKKDLNVLDKIGMNVEGLNSFTAKLKEIAAHHDIKPEDLYCRLFKELTMLDKGLDLEFKVKEIEAQLEELRGELTKGQNEQGSLHTYLKQLKVEKSALEKQLGHYQNQMASDIMALSQASKKAIGEINDSLRLGITANLSEVDKLSEEAVRVGEEVGKLEANIESLSWIKPMLSLIRGDSGLDDYQVRIISLTILRSMSSWLDENYSQDYNLYLLKSNIRNTISELEKWQSLKN